MSTSVNPGHEFMLAETCNRRFSWQVVIDDLPFAEGALRACYRMQVHLSILTSISPNLYCRLRRAGR